MTKDIIKDVIQDQMIHIHRDHISWLKEVGFYENEIQFFKEELEKVINANVSSLSILEHVQEYQGILDRKLFNAEELLEEIKFQQKIFTMDEILPENIEYHLALKEKIDHFVEAMEVLKPMLKRFSSHSD